VTAPDAFHANLQRGALLLQQDRYKEALSFTQAAIAANPDSARGYAQLALCWNGLPRERSKAIPAIDRAIGLEPGNSYYVGLKGWFYVCLARYRAALKTAQQGLAINPLCPQSLNSLANAYTKLAQWKKAEAACRRILELDPNNAPGLNLLAQAQRHLGRWKEARETVNLLLAQYPNNAFGQTNAGFGALAAGDHLRANEHFLNALRMDPHFDLARRGLISSLRARIWIIRWNIRLASLFASVGQRPGTLLNVAGAFLGIIAFICVLSAISQFLNWLHPEAGIFIFGTLFLFGLLYLYLSGIIALMGNFLLLFDPLGRHALTRHEKLKACIPAIGYFWLMALLFMAKAWWLVLALVAFTLLLVFSIQYPLLKDRWQQRRAREELEGQPPV
jgi:tetratricopeptide (TPR) repeat protein